ncbi:cell division cycle protein 123-like [Pelomyxa schiedti]|nr:cell division cycle protein 123-like [Pelomyxa schiedti]
MTRPSPPQVPDALQSISDKIDSIIASFPAHAAMCKLSSRSPKDAAITSQKMNQLVESRLPRIYMTTASLTPTEIDNEKLKILFQSLMESMCVTSGREAIMIMTCSGRVLEDLQMSLEHPNEAPMNIVLREWKRFSVSCEWRGFVHGKTLVALSQYFDTCYFQDVAINKEKIVLTIQTFFDTKLKHRIPLENYIIDFAVAPDWTEVLIIELNPWLPTTDSCLFNWTKDHAVLYGKAPFQARIVEAPLRGLKHHVLSMWHHYFD